MNIVFMGTPDFAVPTLEELVRRGHTVSLVLTKPDAVKGRGKKVMFPVIKEKALSLGLSVLQPERVKDNPELVATLKDLAPDAAVVVAYGKILPPEILSIPKEGCLNVHGSILPRHRGAAPIQWSILSGDEKAGVSIMKMDEGMDTGDVLAAEEVPIGDKNLAELTECLSEMGARLLCDTLAALERGESLIPQPQPEEGATYAPMIQKEDGILDFTRPAAELLRKVRGLVPWPGAFVPTDKGPFKIWQAEVVKGCFDVETGRVISAGEEGILVACGEDALLLKEVQSPGKKRMEAKEYLKGHPIERGAVLG